MRKQVSKTCNQPVHELLPFGGDRRGTYKQTGRFDSFTPCYMPKWCNGSHAGLRGQCPKGREGSTPSFGTPVRLGMSCSAHQWEADGRFSKGIDACVGFIESLGYTVILFDSTLPPTVAGRACSETKTVRLNVSCAGCALRTVAHEAGHVLHYLEVGEGPLPPSEVREAEADRRGKELLVKLGYDGLLDPNDWNT